MPLPLPDLALNPLDATSLLSSFGALGIAAVLFAETGLLVGFFLPGDSLLFTGGPALLARSRSRRLHEGAERAGELLDRYGHAKAVVLARFIPVVRTVLNPLAGALGVPGRTFTLWQCAGGAVWTVGLVLAGYGLGSSIPSVDTYLLPVVALIVVVSLIPLALEVRRSRRAPAAAGTPGRHAAGRAGTGPAGPGYGGGAYGPDEHGAEYGAGAPGYSGTTEGERR
jgi:membrane-associated protein